MNSTALTDPCDGRNPPIWFFSAGFMTTSVLQIAGVAAYKEGR